MHPPYFVPEGKKLMDLLKEFRTNRPKIAIIIDEYGSVDGLITIGDILEEIVGDIIGEEGRPRKKRSSRRRQASISVDPKIPIDEFAEEFEMDIPEGDYDTVGGFITFRMERIPKPGETLEYQRHPLRDSGVGQEKDNKTHRPCPLEEGGLKQLYLAVLSGVLYAAIVPSVQPVAPCLGLGRAPALSHERCGAGQGIPSTGWSPAWWHGEEFSTGSPTS